MKTGIHHKVTKSTKRNFFLLLCVLCVFVVNPSVVLSCPVCAVDPKSPMTHGALAGVLFLLAVVLAVLGSFAAMTFYWIRRARLLQVQSVLRGEKPEIY